MISINFATINYRLRDRLLAGLVAACVLLAVIAAGMLWRTASLRANAASLSVKIKTMETAEAEYRPLLEERDQIVKDLSAVSGLLESRRMSWTGLLTSVESIFPIGVALDKFAYDRKDHVLILNGAAVSPEALRNLMVGLERSSVFKDPYLKHQSIEKGKITFNVVAVHQEYKAAEAAYGK